MKYIEYAHYDIASNETEAKNFITDAVNLKPNSVSVLPTYTKLAKSLLPLTIKLGTVIDYPLGIMDQKSRLLSVENSIRSGCDIIEIVSPSYFLCNRKYDKFREDITKIKELCDTEKVELRYILEYRVFTLELMYKAAQILVGHDIKTIYPSTGYLLDNLSDNILACGLISKKLIKYN
jgi:deoxyribose-phosphate aldolase